MKRSEDQFIEWFLSLSDDEKFNLFKEYYGEQIKEAVSDMPIFNHLKFKSHFVGNELILPKRKK